MRLQTKLLLIAVFFALAMPFVFAGNASALVYTGDGAIHDATTTGWKLPVANGTTNGCLADSTKTSKPDCDTVRFPAYTSGTACSASAEFIANKAQWASVCSTSAGSGVGINLKNLDRNALQCDKLGGVYELACSGKWTDPPAVDTRPGTITGNECLRCHSTTIQRNGTAERWKDSYVKTGHKNMLRKVTAGQPWAGPDGVVYLGTEAGTTIDWTNATITGTSFTGARQLYYIYGDWMAPAANGIYDTTAGGSAGYAKYSCASCHTTGYVATNFVAGMEPNNTYPSLNSGITGSWDMNGIVCSRCHNASAVVGSDAYRTGLKWGSNTTYGSHNNTVSSALRTSLCIECHNSTQTQTDPAGQLKTAATGTGFSGHILGNEFLNSPHAKFTGTSGQVGTAANYASAFKDGDACKIIKTGVTSSSGQQVYEVKSEAECAALVSEYSATSYTWTVGTNQGSCVTCHDVHQSTVPEVGAAEPLKKECTDCHGLKAINHPDGTGSPVNLAGGVNAEACAICHMALESPEGSTHLPVHLWRINTDVNYNTFPTATQWSAGTKIAFTYNDNGYANAVGLDLQLACGQCHNNPTKAAEGVFQIPDKTVLAAQANIIHQGNPGAPVFPAGAGTPVCGGTISGTTGDTSTSFTISDASTIMGGLTGVNTVYIDWGDGSGMQIISAGADASHVFANQGTYKIRKTVQDSLGFGCYTEYTVTISNLAPGGFDTLAVTANGCAGGVVQNVNVYMVAAPLSFHGVTSAAGTVTMPTVPNTMPTGTYNLSVFAPAGGTCYSDALCTLPVAATQAVPGTLTIYCQ